MPNFFAGAHKVQPITMSYSEEWSDEAKAGELVKKTEVEKLYFFIINAKTRAIEATLVDTNEEEIAWIDEDAGEIDVIIASEKTQALTGGLKKYECWALLVSGSKALVDSGEFKLYPSAAASVVA